MSWEAWGSGPEPFDIDELYRYDWESDENAEVWWKAGEPETTYTLQEAIEAHVEWLSCED